MLINTANIKLTRPIASVCRFDLDDPKIPRPDLPSLELSQDDG
jgi:hypothetical protein